MHDAKIVEARQVNNEYVSYRVVCCGRRCGDGCSPSAHICEDTWHTMHVHTDHEEQLNEQIRLSAERCERMERWRQKWNEFRETATTNSE